jgi:glyoxylase-like metal-dependent hydrolase (beta-lactamase superfamily II)
MNTFRLAASVVGLSFLLSGCMGDRVVHQRTPGVVERLYVIDCGENHAKDLSGWTTAADRDKQYVFANHCYLIKHAAGWMLWDSGIADRVAGLPNGVSNPRGTLTQTLKKPLADSLKEVGVSPADIGHFAMSHSHGDHAGNANLFAASTLYMQGSEYDAVFGPEPQKYNFTAANFENLRTAKVVRLNGDHDVFGDGSVVVKSTPGHTPGHQSLFVRLPKTGPVLLSGDFVHLMVNWDAKRVPSINHDAEKSLRSMNEMDTFIKASGARLLINHDREQSASIPKSPAFLD